MTEIIPHINTLIVDVGSEFTNIGYSGDFHPTYSQKTASFSCQGADSAHDPICRLLEKHLKESSVDSLIFLESPDTEFESTAKILKFLFVNKLCQSILFLKSPIADVFGFGKVSGTVLCCSASSFRLTTVINGKIIESQALKGGSIQLGKNVVERIKGTQILQELFPGGHESADTPIILNCILESQDLIDKLRDKYEIDVFETLYSDVAKMVEGISATRSRHHINKKNTATGCIILSGGLFVFDSFYNLIKGSILERIGSDFSDFILREKYLHTTFFGASLFGMNIQTKTMFVTSHDWQKIGTDALKLKTF